MRSALIVATNAYRDERLRQLRAPAHDAAALADVLSDDTLGGFEVDVLSDVDETALRRRVASFFRQRARDDLLLLHFSCHGVKNEHGDLYFAAVDTDLDNLEATALSSSFVNELMSRSLSRRIVLLLDCCYSGAFGRSALARGADGVDLKERFDGRGRVVLTASTSMEYAFEGLDIVGEGTPSVFSAAVADGIRTGAADRDGDGEITVEELYDHVYDTVRVESPSQTPSKWSFDVQGDFLIAKSNAVLDPFRVLPHELTGAVQSPLAHVRESAVTVLSGIMSGYHPAKERRAANSLLELLAQDDSRKVSMAAEAALSDAPSVTEDDRAAPVDPPESHDVPAQRSERTPAVPPTPPPRSVLPDAEPQQAPDESGRATARTEPKPAHDLNRYGRAAALAGASLLVVTCLVVGEGIFSPAFIQWLPLVLPMSASISVGVISLIGLLTLSKDVRWRQAMFCFAVTASLILLLQQAGMVSVGIHRNEAISLLIASALLLVGSLSVLRTGLWKSEKAESHFGARTVVALLTALGGVLLAVSLVLPVHASEGFFVLREDSWNDTFTPLLSDSLWKTFAAYAALAVLAVGVSIWLLFWHPESPDVACGILAAIAALASIFVILVLRSGNLTIGALVLALAAVGFIVAAVLAFRATRRGYVANDASPTAVNAPA
jgi:caspase domain-containing protein